MDHGAVHQDSIATVLLGLCIFFIAAKLGAYLARKLKQPIVLGELLAGILVGNFSLMGFEGFQFLANDTIYGILASLGVILLLFEVGLESKLSDLLKVGALAFTVACIGVVVPSLLGFGVSKLLLPDSSVYTHLFIGTTLCATSVGITARVLQDLKRTQSKEAKIILGAAVIDDILGLIILAVVSALIAGASQGGTAGASLGDIVWISCKAIGFLALSLALGGKFAPHLFKAVARLKVDGSLLIFSLIFCFALSYFANLVGLAPIVGAFAAGLIIDGTDFSKFFDSEKSIEDLMHPLSKFFVPIFFVHTGMQVRLETLQDPKVLTLGLCLALAGILGKQACSLAIFGKNSSVNRLSIGIGMIPRGEVGLIFAMIGKKLWIDGVPVISSSTYSAIIIMVLITTLITPPALKWSFDSATRRSG